MDGNWGWERVHGYNSQASVLPPGRPSGADRSYAHFQKVHTHKCTSSLTDTTIRHAVKSGKKALKPEIAVAMQRRYTPMPDSPWQPRMLRPSRALTTILSRPDSACADPTWRSHEQWSPTHEQQSEE